MDDFKLPCAIGWFDCNQPVQDLKYEKLLYLSKVTVIILREGRPFYT